MNPEERPIWDEIKNWAELLLPSDGPRPVRMEVGPDVVDALKERFAPAPYPNGLTRWTPINQMFGVPIVPRHALAPDAWRILDQFGKIMSQGRIES